MTYGNLILLQIHGPKKQTSRLREGSERLDFQWEQKDSSDWVCISLRVHASAIYGNTIRFPTLGCRKQILAEGKEPEHLLFPSAPVRMLDWEMTLLELTTMTCGSLILPSIHGQQKQIFPGLLARMEWGSPSSTGDIWEQVPTQVFTMTGMNMIRPQMHGRFSNLFPEGSDST